MPDAQFSLCRASSIPELEQKYLVLQILFVWNDLTWPEAKSFLSCVLLWLVLTWMLLRILSAWANHCTLFFASHKWNIDLPEITEKEEKNIYILKLIYVLVRSRKMISLIYDHSLWNSNESWMKWLINHFLKTSIRYWPLSLSLYGTHIRNVAGN